MESNPGIFDRRTLLAFVLMFAVWFVWVTVFPQQTPKEADTGKPEIEALNEDPANENELLPPDPDRQTAGDVEVTSPEPGQPVAVAEGATLWAAVDDSGRGEPIRISTPHFEAQLDPVGADLLEWKLRDYETIEGDPVQLVSKKTLDLGNQYAHALRVELEDHSLDLRRVVFTASEPEIVLNEGDAPKTLVLTADRGDGGQLQLALTFDPERFGFDVDVRFRGASGDALPMAMEISWPGGIAPSEADSALEYREYRSVARVGEDIHKIKFANLAKGGDKGHKNFQGSVSWGGVQSKYFLAAVIDPDPSSGFVRLSGDGGAGIQTFQTNLGMNGQSPATLDYTVFMGPVDFDFLDVYNEEPWNAELTSLVDMGYSLIRPVAEVTLFALRWMHRVIPNWGWTVILFSIITKLAFWPLTRSSTRSMKRMQEIQPELQELKVKYKDNQQKQTEEMMRIYKENKVNPVGGCLPLVIQMPVFVALFSILRKSIDLRQASFMGWIDDLSVPDVLFHLPVSLPVLGDHFSLLPFLMAGAMWAQTKISQSTSTPSAGGENMMGQQMKMMNTMMPIMMFFIFYRSPSGLVLYWLVNTILTAAQTWRVHSQTEERIKAA